MFLNDNRGENPDVLGCGDYFLDITSKAWSMKEMTDNIDGNKV